jgi:NTP pyrophosphatase (non-canonical NTP hydrolase)
VSKHCSDGCITTDFVDYIGDVRLSGNGANAKAVEEETHQVMWQIVSIINYLDMQDAPKKQ